LAALTREHNKRSFWRIRFCAIWELLLLRRCALRHLPGRSWGARQLQPTTMAGFGIQHPLYCMTHYGERQGKVARRCLMPAYRWPSALTDRLHLHAISPARPVRAGAFSGQPGLERAGLAKPLETPSKMPRALPGGGVGGAHQRPLQSLLPSRSPPR
jgi:hypothetical protein